MVEGSQFDDAAPERLAKLLGSDQTTQPSWSVQEIEAIFRHQLGTPLQVELATLPDAEVISLTALADSQGLLLKSIGDLLNHPHPPVKLLAMLKDFAKRLMEHPDSPLPREVASLLYWSAIASGLSRGNVRLTSLDTEQLLAGLRWAASQPWVEKPILELIRSAEASVLARGGG